MKSTKFYLDKVMAIALCLVIIMLPLTSLKAKGKKSPAGTVSFWSIFPQGDPKLKDLENIIAEFESLNPDIKIEHSGTNFWDYFGKLSTAQAAGQAPDVSLNNLNDVLLRAKNGVISSLWPLYAETDMTQFNQNDLDFFTYDEQIYALPFSSDFRVLYYNKDHFAAAGLDPEKPPTTIEELKQYADALDVRDDGMLKRAGFHPKLGNHDVWADIWTLGGTMFKEDGTPNFEDEKVKAGIQQYVDLSNRYTTREFNSFYTTTMAGDLDSFLYGNASMEVSGDWLAWEIMDAVKAGTIEEFNWGAVPYPYSGDNRYAYGVGFSIEMNAGLDDEKMGAAYKFMEFLTSYDVQKRWIELFKFTPVNKRVIEDILTDPATEDNVRNVLTEAAYKRSPEVFEARPLWHDTVTAEVNYVLKNQKTIEQAMSDVNQSLNDALAIYKGENPKNKIDVLVLVVFGALILIVVALVVFGKRRTKK